MTCRDEALAAAFSIVSSAGVNEFSIGDIISEMHRRGTEYRDSTIRTHVTSRMCSNAPPHHQVRYNDFTRIGYGRYALSSWRGTQLVIPPSMAFRDVLTPHT